MPEKSTTKSEPSRRSKSSEKPLEIAGSQPAGTTRLPAQRLQHAAGNQAFNRLVGGSGDPLDEQVQANMEEHFGEDLSSVRIHNGPAANGAARSLHARAFTLGSDIAFQNGLYSPHSSEGRRLLAHELAHVIQQRNAVPLSTAPVGQRDGQAEVEARSSAERIAAGLHSPALNAFSVQTIQRDPDDQAPKYTAASKGVLEKMNQMSDELSKLRSAAPPAKNPAQEAQRTFAVIKVIDENGSVKQSVTGEFLAKGPHAEQQAIGKLDLKNIGPNDTVLVATDQWPCEEKCTPALEKLRAQTKGEFRVFSKAGLNQSGNKVVRSPKTEAKKPGTNANLVELEEFHRSTVQTTGGKSGGGGGGTAKPDTGGESAQAQKGGTQPAAKAPVQEPAEKPSTIPTTQNEPGQNAAPSAKPPANEPAQPSPKAPLNEPSSPAVKNVSAEPKILSKAPVMEPGTPAIKKGGPTTPKTTLSGEPSADTSTNVRPRVTIEGEGAHLRVNTGGWKWAGRIGTGVTVGLQVYGAISTIDDAMEQVEKAQSGSVHPMVAAAMKAVDDQFPTGDDMWKRRFESWNEDTKYPGAKDWINENGVTALMVKGKLLDTMGDHLNTIYWYHEYCDWLSWDIDQNRTALKPIQDEVHKRTRVLFDIAQSILDVIPYYPVDTAQTQLFSIYTTFYNAGRDMSQLESKIEMRIYSYDKRIKEAVDGRRDSAKVLNFWSGAFEKVNGKKVLQTKFSEE